ncbi:hypothetical protein [Micromonospora cathayae]|uniref:Phage major tail protein, phi13 family n=1 Tax=Micromonospora cathayae TaxID=3028804 RepID=A0ABY7ZVV2_9ACTN|nr:hypothetical protein [Micromonospora sp. HUAS 3]WDZ87185.1 hypothetical protein PVK37_12655 [Micromonospora sp. HUAS 3]
MATPTIQPGQIKTGPGLIIYKYGLTTMPTVTAAASKVVFDYATDGWIQVGATEAGLTYTESTSTEAIRVAESAYPVRTVTTEKGGTIAFTMSHISDVNWKLAMNGGTITVTGSGATKLSTYVPPLVGAEVRVALGFISLDGDEAIVWPQVFNGGSVETARSELATKAGLPVEFAVELPDPTILATPYKRWTAGALAQGT